MVPEAPADSPTASATAEPGLAEPEVSSRVRYRGLLLLVAAAFFMQSLDSTVVNTAVPTIADGLQVTPLDLRSALTSYVLTLAVLIPASPWLCDRLGTRRVFGLAITIFGLGSLFCGLAQSLPELVAARVLQGIGGASLLPVGRYVLVRTIDKREFVEAMSSVATYGLLGSVLGPLIGGALVQYTSWRLIFLINVPVAIAGYWMNRHEMPDYRLEHARRFDLSGFLMFATASALLLTASELAGATPLPWSSIVLCALGAIALGSIYVRHAGRVPYPVADLKLLRIRNVRVALSGGIFTRLGISGMFVLLMLFLQVGCGWSPLAAGMIMVPQAIGSILAKRVINRALVHYGYRRMLFGNTLIVATMLALFAVLGPSSPAWLVGTLALFYGGFAGLQYTAMNTLTYNDLDIRHAAMASSLASTAQYLAMSFGIALSMLLMQGLLQGHASGHYVVAFRWTVLVLALITALASRIFRQLPPDRPRENAAVA